MLSLRETLDKTFLLSIGAVCLLAYVIVANQRICRWTFQKVEQWEQVDSPDFPKLRSYGGSEFKRQHLNFLKVRCHLAEAVSFLNHCKLCLDMCQRNLELYEGSCLNSEAEFQKLIYLKALSLHRLLELPEARAAYSEYVSRFPDGPLYEECQTSIKLIDALNQKADTALPL